MRIALVIPEWGQVAGGLATYYRHLVPELQQAGHEVQVFVGSAYFMDQPSDQPFVHVLRAEDQHKHLPRFSHLQPLAGLGAHLAAAWGLRDRVQQVADHTPFDLVECCDWGLGFVPWVCGDTPLVVRLHASLSQIARAEQLAGEAAFQSMVGLLEQVGLGLADELVTYSSANAKFWSRQLSRPVSLNRPAYPVEPAASGQGGGLASGKIQRWKGVELLCEAMSRLPETHIHWYGRDMPTADNGRLVSMSKRLARKYPKVWPKRLQPQGMVSPQELKKRRQQAGFVVVPSSWDVFNFTAVEAMAAAIPVIVCQGAGASELVDHGRNGLTFAPDNPDQLADCLSQLSAMSASQRRAMGQAGRATVAEELEPAARAAQHLGVYQALLDSPREPRGSDPWDHLLCAGDGRSGALDMASNLSGRVLGKALLQRVGQRFGGRR